MEQHISELSCPITVVEALNDKYSEENCMLDDFAHIQLSSNVRAQLQGHVLLPHEKREIVTLDGCGITSAGKPGEIANVCPLISELDVTNNKINEWNEVFKIVSQLKKLHFLNLCGNHLDDSSYSSVLHLNNMQTSVFDSLVEVVLNNTNVSLCTVQRLLKVLPSVEKLHLSLNQYLSVPDCEEVFESVKRLHFNGNSIKHWQEVEKLGKMFPKLQELLIMDNPLESLQRENKDSYFVSLKSLCLTKTMLNNWDDIDVLRTFVCLKEVKVIGIPLLTALKEDEARKLLVARLPNIEFLNGNHVLSNERNIAERHFIREYQAEEHPPGRYQELVAIHGELSKLADVNLAPVEFVDVVLHITGRAPRLQKISTKQTASEFRKYISEMIQLPIKKFLLYYYDVEFGYAPEKMVYRNGTLYRYGVKSGDEFYVDILE